MDITMCSSENCPKKLECLRSPANTSSVQSWYNFEYECNEGSGFCEYISFN